MAPRSHSIVRSPDSDSTTTVPVARPGARRTAQSTPASASSASRCAPAASAPTTPTSVTGTPTEASQAAVLAADPPAVSETAAAVSVPVANCPL